jgi:transcriptional regulator with PAS, ATPase and Fis domain
MEETTVLVGATPVMHRLRDEISNAARSDAKVLVTGESGSGKEITARMIHVQSNRAQAPYITLNCAGLTETLLESELFGHVRGSFTGAYRDKPGLLELAHRGTLFLDEIGEMSLRMQSAFLRFLETGEIQRVGETRIPSRLDVRIIAATNRDLKEMIAAKTFREDLYYRLNVIHLSVPPLRERRDDIPLLAAHLSTTLSGRFGTAPAALSQETLAVLSSYAWPGNVRELRNIIERLVVRRGGSIVEPADLPDEVMTITSALGAAAPAVSPADGLFAAMVKDRESFWTAVYRPFMSRDLTRQELQKVVSYGLERTRGNYRSLVELFNMPPDDYKRFLNFLRKHQCHVPFQHFRGMASVRLVAPSAERRPASHTTPLRRGA